METVIKPQHTRTAASTELKLHGISLLMMGRNNKFRIFVTRIVLHPLFDPFIITIIILSTILMAIDNPLNDPNGALTVFLFDIDVVITVIFVLESVLKIVNLGLVFNGKTSYLRVSWNIMDFVIIVFSVSITYF